MAWAQTFADTFTDTAFTALPSHNAAWAQDTANGTWRIGSNGTSAGLTVNVTGRCYLTGAVVPAADQAAEYTLKIGVSPPELRREEGITLRFTDGDSGNFWGGTGYVAYIETDNHVYLHRLDGGGSHTQIASAVYIAATNDVYRFEVIGSGLDVKANGISLTTATDATHTSGTVGLWSGLSFDDTAAMSIDDFAAYEQIAGGEFLLVAN